MKRIIHLIIVFLLCSLGISAQEFTVKSFKLVSENASATHEVLKDNNDNPCAILRIKTSENGVKIAGNVVGKIMSNGNEYILNVASGTKKITVVKKGMLPLTVNFIDYKIKALKSKASYELVLGTAVRSNEVSGEIYGHEYVDLGLSVKWATYNIGASKIAEPGKMYKYGETVEYDEDRPYTFTSEWGDEWNKITLANDVAHTLWGGTWRLPTSLEWEELEQNCQIVWTSKDGVLGAFFIAKNGNKIFLPVTTNTTMGGDLDLRLQYMSDSYFFEYSRFTISRYQESLGAGRVAPNERFMVRAVSDIPKYQETWSWEYTFKPDGYNKGHAYVDLGLSVKWATTNIGATTPFELGDLFKWGETSPNPSDIQNVKLGYIKSDYRLEYNCAQDKVYGIKGRDELRAEDDVASVKWGFDWHVPTKEEMNELIEKCSTCTIEFLGT